MDRPNIISCDLARFTDHDIGRWVHQLLQTLHTLIQFFPGFYLLQVVPAGEMSHFRRHLLAYARFRGGTSSHKARPLITKRLLSSLIKVYSLVQKSLVVKGLHLVYIRHEFNVLLIHI